MTRDGDISPTCGQLWTWTHTYSTSLVFALGLLFARTSKSHYSIHFLYSFDKTISGVTLTVCIACLLPQKAAAQSFVFYLLHAPSA